MKVPWCGIFVCVAFFLTIFDLTEGCTSRKLKFDLPMKGKRLLNHVINSKQAESETWCRWFCLWDNNCVSINFNDTEDSDKQHLCELNGSDEKQHPDDLKDAGELSYHRTKNPCSNNSSCSKNGVCQTGFGCEGYRCVCQPGYSGKACEIYQFSLPGSVILRDYPDYQKKLDEFLEPVQVSGKQWKLCFRASEHNYSAAAFHASCDKKGATVTLVRVGIYIFGGYADKSWDKDDRTIDSDAAFLFSLKNELNKPHKLLSHKSNEYAIRNPVNCGPTFGAGNDVRLSNACDSNTASYSNLGGTYKPPDGYYPNSKNARKFLAGSYYFECDEYEVFYEA